MSKRNIIRANRQNSKLSTGPISPDGKARASQNSLVHGVYAKSALLPTEDPEEYRKHQESFDPDLQPEGPLQRALADMITDNIWRMKRLRLLEEKQAAVYFAELAKRNQLPAPAPNPVAAPEAVNQEAPPSPDGFVPNVAVQHVNPKDDPNYRNLDALGRHHQRIQQGTLKVLKTLRDLQKEIRVTTEQADMDSGALEQKFLNKLRADYSSRRYSSVNPFSPYWNGNPLLPTPSDEVLLGKKPIE